MTTDTPSVDEARAALWAAYYEVQAAVQNPGTLAPDMLRAIATFEAALIRERDEAVALLRAVVEAAEAASLALDGLTVPSEPREGEK